ncbi:uncharacterized protein BXIN_2428 [Babesia sp. Xinjiang]|uniref:uncharacterized protein n=1 Tax=Babesia sp. Xinjiang TaxID=462227 RepID=UPI000A24F87D|nr:uncharacterized protein BXIN_2428 [Babesia sp. Xinjiang]ORM39888.1 hypothetical protein BXIN_2428 [Babesia sp. Xinjiang]
MGFNKDCLSQSYRTGNCIYWIVEYFTQSDRNYVSLYNIIICLICCSLRTPRTVGDLFAFFLYAGYYMDNGLDTAIKQKMKDFPVDYSTESKEFTTAFKKLVGETHTGGKHTPEADLRSLYDSECDNKSNGKTCGQYLQSLSYSIYCNISTTFAKSYLSRIVYLTDVLKDGLEELLTEFKNLKCEHCKNANHQRCQSNCHSTNQCSCETIVQCADVLPLFFKFGFTYYSAAALNGTDGVPGKKRKCKAFYDELKNLLDVNKKGKPFSDLLSAINTFLLCIRQPFLLYLLTFWLVAILYFSYGLTIPLDLFHIRSHWRRGLSHQISVLALLSKKGLSPTKVAHFTP